MKKDKKPKRQPESIYYVIRLDREAQVGYSLDARPEQSHDCYSLEVSGEVLEPKGRAKYAKLLLQGSNDRSIEGSILGIVYTERGVLHGWIQMEGEAWPTVLHILRLGGYMLVDADRYCRTQHVRSFQFATISEGF